MMISVTAMTEELTKLSKIKCRSRAVPIRVSNLVKKETMDRRLYKKAGVLPEFLAKPRRGGKLDLRSDDFNKNQALGRSVVPAMGTAAIAAILTAARGASPAKVLGTSAAAGMIGGGLRYSSQLKKFRRQQKMKKTAGLVEGALIAGAIVKSAGIGQATKLLKGQGSKIGLIGSGGAAVHFGGQAKKDWAMGRAYRKQMESRER